MASFTDQVPQFNPYVSQQPVEAMVQVGMMKQQQYDTNLQRIYQSMSNVKGLDIIKDADKAYLDDKMSSVGKQMRVYASGDFSQSNLTRGVNNMVNSIADDKIVQTAVQSTAKVRSEVGKMTEAQKNGKSSVVNEYYLNKDINDWIQGTEAGESFSGKWTPYSDVDKKLREVYESMEDTDISIENPFQRDSNGNTLYFSGPNDRSGSTDPSKGQQRIDHAMLKKTVKGKNAEKILNNFYTSLSADEIRQLDMNGGYHYRGATAESFAPAIKKAGETKKEFYKKTIEMIAVELESNPNLTADQKKEYFSKAKEYQTALNSGSVDKEVQSQLQELRDPNKLEQMKSSVYKDQYLRNMALNMATESVSIEYKNNPYFDADMKMKDYNLKLKEFNNKVAHQDRMFGLEMMKINLEYNPDAGIGRVRPGDVSTEVDESSVKVSTYEKEIEDINSNIRVIGANVIPHTTLQMLDLDESDTKGLDAKGVAELKFKALDNMYGKWKGGTKFENASLNSYFATRESLEEKQSLNYALIAGANKAASVQNKQIEDLNKNHKGYIVDGEYFSFQEITELNKDYNQYSYHDRGEGPGILSAIMGGAPAMKTDMNTLRKIYAGTKKGRLLEKLYNYDQNDGDGGEVIGEIKSALIQVSVEYNNLLAKREQIRTEYIRKNSYKLASKQATLNMNAKATANNVDVIVKELASDAGSIGATDTLKNIDFETINNFRKDPNTAYTIEKHNDGSGAIIFDNVSIGKRQVIPVTAEQLSYYFPKTQESNPLEKALDFVRINNGLSNTAGIYGANGASSAVYKLSDFPSVAQRFKEPRNYKFDIKGDPSNNGDAKWDRFTLITYINSTPGKEPAVWIMREMPDFVNTETVYQQILNFNPSIADDILKQNYNKQKTQQ